MKLFVQSLGQTLLKLALVIVAGLAFRHGMILMFNLPEPNYAGADDWKEAIGTVLVFFSFICFYEYFKWTDRK